MTVAMSKSKKAPTAKTAPKDQQKDEIRAKVDRLAELRQKLAAQDHIALEASKIESELKQLANTLPGSSLDQPITFAGTNMAYVLDACKMQRTINSMQDVAKAMGAQLFMNVAKVGLADIDKYLSEAERAKLLTSARGTVRIGKLVPKG